MSMDETSDTYNSITLDFLTEILEPTALGEQFVRSELKSIQECML